LQKTATYAAATREKLKRLHLTVCGTVHCISCEVFF